MKYLSVCSGIEAASVAWHQLGWEPVGFAEIEKFPSQVLAHRFPGVKNFGDMTRFKEWNIDPGTVDLLVGGTPCQAFSVAGLRKGLADPRGNLALTFVAMVDHYRPEWVVWENVPGVLSSNGGRDFGSFLGALAELGYGFAYRVLDAQYFGVAQRRRRVFLVAHSSGDPTRAASVLFEPESLRGDPAPSRETREGASANLVPSVAGSLDTQCGGGKLTHQSIANGHLIGTITARMFNALGARDVEEGALIPIGLDEEQNASINLFGTLKARTEGGGFEGTVMQPSLYESHPHDSRVTGPVEQSPTVSARWGTGGNNTPLVTDGGMHFRKSKRAQSVDDDETWVESDVTNTMNVFDQGDVRATDVVVQPGEASAFSWKSRGDMRGMVPRPTAQLQRCQIEAVMVQPAMHVRRLTPVECERLQGFPDGWTDICVYRCCGLTFPSSLGKYGCPNCNGTKEARLIEASDSGRYKALGNSMAVPVMRWIGRRIESCR